MYISKSNADTRVTVIKVTSPALKKRKENIILTIAKSTVQVHAFRYNVNHLFCENLAKCNKSFKKQFSH